MLSSELGRFAQGNIRIPSGVHDKRYRFKKNLPKDLHKNRMLVFTYDFRRK